MIKVLITKKVNIRFGAPNQHAQIKGTLKPGFEIEVTPVDGESIDGIKRWYRDRNGDYIWGGSVRIVGDEEELDFNNPPEIINWADRVANIPGEWKQTKGKNIKVAILDSGIYRDHPDFSHLDKSLFFDVTNSPFGTDDKHNLNHGTHCTGLIAAKTNRIYGVIGVAPEVELYNIKVTAEDISHTAGSVADGISKAREKKVHIISMSLAIGDENNSRLNKEISEAVKEKIVLIGAAGDNNWLHSPKIDFPALHKDCLAIGAISQAYYNQDPEKAYNRTLDYILPYQKMWSCVNNESKFYQAYAGCSMATALMSGIIALYLSHKNYQQTRFDNYLDQIRSALDQRAFNLNETLDINNKTLHIIKPQYV